MNFIFIVSHLKTHPAVHLNTSKPLMSLQSKRKVCLRFTYFPYSYILTRVKNYKIVAESLDVQIEQTRIYCSNVIITILQHIVNPGIVRTVY